MARRNNAVRSLVGEMSAYYGVKPTLCVFGLGFSMCFCYSSQRLTGNTFDGWFQIAQYCGMAVAGLLFALYAWRFRSNLSSSPHLVPALLVACVALSPFVVLVGPWSSNMPFMLAIAALDGAAFVLLSLIWGSLYAQLNVRQAFWCICGFLIVSSAVKMFLDLLSHDIVSTVVLAGLAVASVACLHASKNAIELPQPAQPCYTRQNLATLRGLCVAMFLVITGVALCMSLTRGAFGLPFGFRVASQVATIVISLVALYAAYRLWEDITPFTLWYLVVLVIASGLAVGVLAGAPLDSLSSAVFTTSQMLSIGFVWLAFSDVAHRSREASDLIFGAGWALVFAMPMALGLAIPHLLPKEIDVGSLMVVVIWLLLIALLFFNQRQSPELRLLVGFSPQVSNPNDAGMDERMDSLARTYGLTNREQEVVALYAQGRSRAFISNQLVLSENTVRDHIKSAYKKFGIHNKQELIDLIE